MMDKTDIRAIATSITIKNSDNIEMKKQLNNNKTQEYGAFAD